MIPEGNDAGRAGGAKAAGDLVREARVERRTSETEVSLLLRLDGSGESRVSTGIGFFDHMLALFTRHGLFDLELEATGDLATGGHHTVEDVGICLGLAVDQALKDRAGIGRYGSMLLPMDESLALVALDLSGRPYLAYEVELPNTFIGGFDTDLAPEFFQAFVNNARATLHLRLLTGNNPHHIVESLFKGFGRALDQATRPDPRAAGIPSTKGVL
jgi:imidazoleglycerol-phosphate dehydratase